MKSLVRTVCTTCSYYMGLGDMMRSVSIDRIEKGESSGSLTCDVITVLRKTGGLSPSAALLVAISQWS